MLSQKLQSALNEQIRNEIASAYLYLAMSAWFEDKNYPGAAHWMREQYTEELEHAARFIRYMNDRNARVILEAIDKPPPDFASYQAVFEAVLTHEQQVTASIGRLYELAVAEKEAATQVELHWFIKEQVEEEKTVQEVLVQLEACGGKPHLLMFIDRRLGKRGASSS
jgi:ferritin